MTFPSDPPKPRFYIREITGDLTPRRGAQRTAMGTGFHILDSARNCRLAKLYRTEDAPQTVRPENRYALTKQRAEHKCRELNDAYQ